MHAPAREEPMALKGAGLFFKASTYASGSCACTKSATKAPLPNGALLWLSEYAEVDKKVVSSSVTSLTVPCNWRIQS